MKRAVIIFAAVLIAGALYDKVGEHRDRSRYPQIGRSVDIGGRSLNIFCSGEGRPTVMFEGAGHTAGYAWAGMQADVARFTRACWYDRAGYGWSDPGPSPRTFRSIASDLSELLRAASEPGPYVLVGAAAGAFHVRVFRGLYPHDVAGAVLIHADDPDVFEHEPAFMKSSMASMPALLQQFACRVVRPVTVWTGLNRLMGNPGAGRPFGISDVPRAQREELLFLSNNPATAQTEGEGCVLQESMDEVRASGSFGDLPLSVLTGDAPFRAPAPQYQQAVDALNDYWFHQLQPRLAALSTRGHLVISDRAQRPDGIVEAIRNVVAEVRSSAR